ncbi:SseB family protein [Micromonospora sp. NPDC047074]|uniref:SseB family protein n=1 Tax=Micromonospora sp. NPDC047074 TaxID=3154339 RepID=UPI0033D28FC1
MTAPDWSDIVDRLHDTLARCDRDTDLELAAGRRRLHLLVRRDTVRGVCPPYDERRLAELGWRAPRAAGGWWYETPRTAEGLHWWSGFVAQTAAAVLTTEPATLSCEILPPTGPRVRPEPTVPLVRRGPAEPVVGTAEPEPGPGPDPADSDSDSADGPGSGATGRADDSEGVPAPDGPPMLDLLAGAAGRRDLPGYLGVLAAMAVCVPLATEPGPDRGVQWTVVTDPVGAPLLPVFTSPEALTAFAGEGVPFVAVPCADLLADWPDPGWGLVVDAGTPRALALGAAALATLLAANPRTD